MRHQSRPTPETNGADERESLPTAKWSLAHCALAQRRPAVLAPHAGFAERLVDIDEFRRTEPVDELQIRGAPDGVLGRVALCRHEALFFREKPSRRSARCTEDTEVATDAPRLSASASSAAVASGIAATRARSSVATCSPPVIGDGFPPPRGRGSIEPVSRCSRRTRLTVAYPIPSSCAVSSYDNPRSRALRMASRIATDIGAPMARTDHAHPIDSSAFCFSQWADMAVFDLVDNERLSTLVTSWPSNVAIEVRCCPHCGGTIARKTIRSA
jgi:hypothetical protein